MVEDTQKSLTPEGRASIYVPPPPFSALFKEIGLFDNNASKERARLVGELLDTLQEDVLPDPNKIPWINGLMEVLKNTHYMVTDNFRTQLQAFTPKSLEIIDNIAKALQPDFESPDKARVHLLRHIRGETELDPSTLERAGIVLTPAQQETLAELREAHRTRNDSNTQEYNPYSDLPHPYKGR